IVSLASTASLPANCPCRSEGECDASIRIDIRTVSSTSDAVSFAGRRQAGSSWKSCFGAADRFARAPRPTGQQERLDGPGLAECLRRVCKPLGSYVCPASRPARWAGRQPVHHQHSGAWLLLRRASRCEWLPALNTTRECTMTLSWNRRAIEL